MRGPQFIPHVGGEIAKNVVEGNLIPINLVLELSRGQLAVVLVGPCVTRDLMAFGGHPLFPVSIYLRISSW